MPCPFLTPQPLLRSRLVIKCSRQVSHWACRSAQQPPVEMQHKSVQCKKTFPTPNPPPEVSGFGVGREVGKDKRPIFHLNKKSLNHFYTKRLLIQKASKRSSEKYYIYLWALAKVLTNLFYLPCLLRIKASTMNGWPR